MTREQMIDAAVRSCIEPEALPELLWCVRDWTEQRGRPIGELKNDDDGPFSAICSEFRCLKNNQKVSECKTAA